MPRSQQATQCTICRHRERAGIDHALACGVSMYALAKRYKVGSDSLYRHRKRHMPPQLKASLLAGPSIEGVDLDKLKERESQSLLMNLVTLRARLFNALNVSEDAGDIGAVTRVASQLHVNLETTGKLLGDLGAGVTNVNVLILPAYIQLRVELVKALQPYPEARQAVAKVLHQLEGDAAQVIKNDKRELAS